MSAPNVRVLMARSMGVPFPGQDGAMTYYRVYLITAENHITDSKLVEAEGDDEALALAQQYVDGYDVEVWDHNRKIGRLSFDHKK